MPFIVAIQDGSIPGDSPTDKNQIGIRQSPRQHGVVPDLAARLITIQLPQRLHLPIFHSAHLDIHSSTPLLIPFLLCEPLCLRVSSEAGGGIAYASFVSTR